MDTNSGAAPAKPFWQSKTIIGAVVTGGVVIAGFMGAHVDDASKSLVIDQTEALIGAGVALAGTVMAIYGRVVAAKKIG